MLLRFHPSKNVHEAVKQFLYGLWQTNLSPPHREFHHLVDPEKKRFRCWRAFNKNQVGRKVSRSPVQVQQRTIRRPAKVPSSKDIPIIVNRMHPLTIAIRRTNRWPICMSRIDLVNIHIKEAPASLKCRIYWKYALVRTIHRCPDVHIIWKFNSLKGFQTHCLSVNSIQPRTNLLQQIVCESIRHRNFIRTNPTISIQKLENIAKNACGVRTVQLINDQYFVSSPFSFEASALASMETNGPGTNLYVTRSLIMLPSRLRSPSESGLTPQFWRISA